MKKGVYIINVSRGTIVNNKDLLEALKSGYVAGAALDVYSNEIEYVNKDIARRIIDVVSGAAHALDGHMQKISSSIFLVAPYNYDITSETREETKSKLPVSWLKSNANN